MIFTYHDISPGITSIKAHSGAQVAENKTSAPRLIGFIIRDKGKFRIISEVDDWNLGRYHTASDAENFMNTTARYATMWEKFLDFVAKPR